MDTKNDINWHQHPLKSHLITKRKKIMSGSDTNSDGQRLLHSLRKLNRVEKLNPKALQQEFNVSTHPTNRFPCTRCGLCCQHLKLSPLYAALDRGDGVCQHYDKDARACSIYDSRPALCRIDESYPFFAAQMSHDDYHRANLQACQELINRFGSGQQNTNFN